MTPHVNVLLAAARSDHPHHDVARHWLEAAITAAAGGAPFTRMPMVLASVLRLITSPKVFVEATPADEAVALFDALLALPGVTLAALGPEWPKRRQLCLDKQLSRNDLPDAWLAVAVEQQGEHLVSFDRGLRRLLGRARLRVLQARASARVDGYLEKARRYQVEEAREWLERAGVKPRT